MGYDGYAWFSGDGVGGKRGLFGTGSGADADGTVLCSAVVEFAVLCCAVLCGVGRDSRGVGRGT